MPVLEMSSVQTKRESKEDIFDTRATSAMALSFAQMSFHFNASSKEPVAFSILCLFLLKKTF